MRTFKKISLKLQILIGFGLLSVVAAFISGEAMRKFETSYLLEKKWIESNKLVEYMAAVSLDPLIVIDIPALETIVQQAVKNDPQISSFKIRNADRVIVHEWISNDRSQAKDYLSVDRLMDLEGEHFGTIQVEWDKSATLAEIERHVTLSRFAVIATLLALAGIMILFIHFVMIRNVNGIIDRLKSLTSGKAKVSSISPYAAIELQQLDRTVRDLGVAWEVKQKREQELSESRDHLQEMVDIATGELTEALAQEKKLNKLQREFVSMASHEFRTPLTIIDATAQRMKSQADKNKLTPEDAARRIEKIRSAVLRMTQLIDSTLTAARMEEGKIKIEIESCDIGKVVREVCARQQELSTSHVISYDLSNLPVTIQADPNSLEQVITNLLSNAVKYAPDAPEIEVKGSTQGDQVVISVRDHGIGIDADELGKIGDRFFRAKTSTGTAGTGIGLNLVKMLVELHKGSFSVESQKGEGSTFTIRLPNAGPYLLEQTESKVA